MGEDGMGVASEDGNPAERVMLGGRYQVHPDRPLPALDSPLADAVQVTDTRAASRTMFGLVCRPGLMPRVDIIPQLSRLAQLSMLNPCDADTVAWPQSGGRRFVIVFDGTPGERLATFGSGEITRLSEDRLVRTVIAPMMPVLRDLGGRLITHRAIRADNLFYADTSRQATVLGECVSAPPAFSQPVAYEPIDSAMARPSGRGPGRPTDDLYALGATLAMLICGGEPIAGLSDDEIIASKISSGSYATLIGQRTVSLSFMEPLRGLLCDDPRERWIFDDLEMWMGGRQLSPRQPMVPSKAARPIALAGKEYWSIPALSHAMGCNWREAGKLIVGGELESWLRRTLSDEATAKSVQTVLADSRTGSDDEDRLISRILIVLDPTLPVRFKGFAARLDGIGQSLAIEFHDREIRQAFAEMMNAKLPQAWLQSQPGSRADHPALLKSFDMISYFLRRPRIGQGIERALYECNRGWPCQSPLVLEDYVSEIDGLLPALERAAKRGSADREPVDRHIAAFCAARFKTMPERVLSELSDRAEVASTRRGMLRLLAEVQRTTSKDKFPALSQWLARVVRPCIETYHNRAYRKRVARELDRASGNGDLAELLFLIESTEARIQDSDGFEQAKSDYLEQARTIAWLGAGGLTDEARVRGGAHQAAIMISAMVSGLTMIVLTLSYVL